MMMFQQSPFQVVAQKPPWKDEPIYAAKFSWFGETDFPVTSRSIWKEGEDVTRLVRQHRTAIMALILSAKKGLFSDSRVRLGIATDSGYTMYIDNLGGVRTTLGDSKLSATQFAQLKGYLPKIHKPPRALGPGKAPRPLRTTLP